MSPDRTASSSPGLYVHVPFCSAICPYCDFAVTRGDEEARARFVERLLREIEIPMGPENLEAAEPCDTVYFGGGTPSLLSPNDLARVVERLVESGVVEDNAALHIEANPEDVDEESLRSWLELGTCFLSLGVQSFADDALAFLGRRHRARDARRAVAMALDTGFPTVSLDLIYGLPDRDDDDWRRDLDRALELRPDHVSCYQLTVHAETPFGRRRDRGSLREASNETQAALFRATHEHLFDSGYEGYEVSNFARSEAHRSRHNQKYWNHTPYRGIGPSAHSFDGRSRWWNARSLSEWSRRVDGGESPVSERETLDTETLALEALMLGFRTKRGLDLDSLETRFGVRLLEWNRALVDRLVEEGLIHVTSSWLRPTLAGMAVADGLAGKFALADHEVRAS
jgi:oxygen-independent coproporphyrinogen-3 oxidase